MTRMMEVCEKVGCFTLPIHMTAWMLMRELLANRANLIQSLLGIWVPLVTINVGIIMLLERPHWTSHDLLLGYLLSFSGLCCLLDENNNSGVILLACLGLFYSVTAIYGRLYQNRNAGNGNGVGVAHSSATNPRIPRYIDKGSQTVEVDKKLRPLKTRLNKGTAAAAGLGAVDGGESLSSESSTLGCNSDGDSGGNNWSGAPGYYYYVSPTRGVYMTGGDIYENELESLAEVNEDMESESSSSMGSLGNTSAATKILPLLETGPRDTDNPVVLGAKFGRLMKQLDGHRMHIFKKPRN